MQSYNRVKNTFHRSGLCTPPGHEQSAPGVSRSEPPGRSLLHRLPTPGDGGGHSSLTPRGPRPARTQETLLQEQRKERPVARQRGPHLARKDIYRTENCAVHGANNRTLRTAHPRSAGQSPRELRGPAPHALPPRDCRASRDPGRGAARPPAPDLGESSSAASWAGSAAFRSGRVKKPEKWETERVPPCGGPKIAVGARPRGAPSGPGAPRRAFFSWAFVPVSAPVRPTPAAFRLSRPGARLRTPSNDPKGHPSFQLLPGVSLGCILHGKPMERKVVDSCT